MRICKKEKLDSAGKIKKWRKEHKDGEDIGNLSEREENP
jgi:hypothetical protein